MKIIRKTARWIVQHINLILLVLILVQCILALHAGFTNANVKREYERVRIENQIQIEKAQTEKELAIIEAEKEAEVLRIKNGQAGDPGK